MAVKKKESKKDILKEFGKLGKKSKVVSKLKIK